mgnify:CR=1 FL=1
MRWNLIPVTPDEPMTELPMNEATFVPIQFEWGADFPATMTLTGLELLSVPTDHEVGDDPPSLMRWLPARAHDNGLFLLFSNGVGIDDEVRTGNAMIIDPYGRIIAETWRAADEMVVADLDGSRILKETMSGSGDPGGMAGEANFHPANERFPATKVNRPW